MSIIETLEEKIADLESKLNKAVVLGVDMAAEVGRLREALGRIESAPVATVDWLLYREIAREALKGETK